MTQEARQEALQAPVMLDKDEHRARIIIAIPETLGGEIIFMMQGTQQQPVLVGTSLPRQDGPDKVTGRARYAGDQAAPGMLYARLVLSPYAHARILGIDTSQALAVPGVVAVFTAETLGTDQTDMSSRAQSPLAIHEVMWSGHPVAIVVGETEAIAEDGAT